MQKCTAEYDAMGPMVDTETVLISLFSVDPLTWVYRHLLPTTQN